MNFLPGLLGAALPFFGGQDQEDPQMSMAQKRIFDRLLQMARSQSKFSRTNPFSQTQEREGLAQTLGLFGQAARRGNEAAFAGMSPTSLQSPSVDRARSNLAASNQAQQSGIYSQAYQGGLLRRDQARQNAQGLFGQAGQIAGSPANPGQQAGGLGDLFPLLQMFGQQYGMRGGMGGSPSGSSYYNPLQGTSGFDEATGARGGVPYF